MSLIGSIYADMLTGGAGNDTIDGGGAASGNMYVTNAHDTIDGGGGNDTLTFSAVTSGVTVDLTQEGSIQNTGGGGNELLTSIENITGSIYGDTLTGDDGANTLRGLAGDDTIHGGAGNDSISGGAGNDYIDGGDGIDAASYGQDGAVHVDLAITGPQDTGGSGTDTLVSIENLYGSAFNDTLYGNSGNNLLIGNGGDDILQGRDGDDTLQGRDGNDTLVGGNGNDILDGGAGIDTASYLSASARVIVSLLNTGPQNTQGAGIDTITNVENLIGSNYNDVLGGDGNANTISGGNGDDMIAGRGGADTLIGGAGADHFIWYSASESTVAARDTVNDMTSADFVDLSGVDANVNVAGDQAFALVSAFSHVAGQATLTYNAATNQSLFLGDINGDGTADFAIRFLGDVSHFTDHFML